MLIRKYSLEYGKYSWECSCTKIYSKKFSVKGFFVITDVYLQNMIIRNCDYAS